MSSTTHLASTFEFMLAGPVSSEGLLVPYYLTLLQDVH